MTATLTDFVDLAAFEEDVARPCDVKKCDNPAEWAVWLKHGWLSCPQDWYACTLHKDQGVEIVRRAIARDDPACSDCNDLHMAGHLISEYIKPVSLH